MCSEGNLWPYIYQGKVVENNDPEKRGRIVAICPEVLGLTVPLDWAEPMMLFPAGNDFGSPIVPDIGSMVWIQFQNGDQNLPVYCLAMAAIENGVPEIPKLARGIPDETVSGKANVGGSPFAAQYPYNRVIKTNAGLVVELDDTPGAERIHLWHPSGSFLEFWPNGKVVMHAAADFEIYVDGKLFSKAALVEEVAALIANKGKTTHG